MTQADFEATAIGHYQRTQPMGLDELPPAMPPAPMPPIAAARAPGPGIAPAGVQLPPARPAGASRQPASADPDCVRITGTLTADAVLRYAPKPEPGHSHRRAWLSLHMATPGGLLVEASQDCGTQTAAHHAAISKARHLRTGTRATVWAKGAMVITRRTAEPTLVLLLPTIVIQTADPRTGGDAP